MTGKYSFIASPNHAMNRRNNTIMYLTQTQSALSLIHVDLAFGLVFVIAVDNNLLIGFYLDIISF